LPLSGFWIINIFFHKHFADCLYLSFTASSVEKWFSTAEGTTLVNEFQTAGSYQIEFISNELNLSNGIYFYQLKAGNFVKTRKMVLLK
jgi:hypothetical protein